MKTKTGARLLDARARTFAGPHVVRAGLHVAWAGLHVAWARLHVAWAPDEDVALLPKCVVGAQFAMEVGCRGGLVWQPGLEIGVLLRTTEPWRLAWLLAGAALRQRVLASRAKKVANWGGVLGLGDELPGRPDFPG